MAEKSLIAQLLFKIGRRIRQSDWYIFSNYLLFDKIPGRFFMTVKLGSYPDFKALHKALVDSEKHFDDDVVKILKRHKIGSETEYVDLWEVSVIELGFTRSILLSEIYKRAFKFSFKKCSWEAIVLSCIKCEDKKWRVGGTDPVIYFGNDPFFYGDHLLPLMFGLGDGFGLDANFMSPDGLWSLIVS